MKTKMLITTGILSCSPLSYPYVDVYILKYVNKTGKVITTRGPCDFQPEWIWPLTTIEMYGTDFPAPRNVTGMLEHLYGKNFTIELGSGAHGSGHACVPPKKPKPPVAAPSSKKQKR